MEGKVKKITRWIMIISLSAGMLSSCGIDADEVFDSLSGKVDEQDEKKAKP